LRAASGYQILAEQEVDAVLTPEGALPFLWTVMRSSFLSCFGKGVVAWVGAFEQGLFTLAGEIFSRYNKAKLVPLGEYILEQFWDS